MTGYRKDSCPEMGPHGLPPPCLRRRFDALTRFEGLWQYSSAIRVDLPLPVPAGDSGYQSARRAVWMMVPLCGRQDHY